jgi:ribonuclease P protein component
MFSFPKKGRLHHQQDFQAVFSRHYKVTCRQFIALYRTNQLDRARLGIIIKKRLVKSAVDRNQIKRLVRESFRHHQAVVKGFDMIVLLRSTPFIQEQLAKIVLRNDIDNLWPRLIHSLTYESELNRR